MDSGLDISHESNESDPKQQNIFLPPTYIPPQPISLPNGLNFSFEDLCPVVKLQRMPKKIIHQLTKHKDRAKNVKEYVRLMRHNKRHEMKLQVKQRRKSLDEIDEMKRKMTEIQNFLDFCNGSELMRLTMGIDKYKRSVVDIDRYSDTTSIADSEMSSNKRRSGRQSLPPKIFTYTSLEKPAKRIKLEKVEEPEIEYQIEAIRNISLVNQGLLFEVKWANYPESVNTWEPLENLGDCEALDRYIEHELKDELESLEREMLQIIAEEKPKYEGKNKAFIIQELQKFNPVEFEINKVAYKHARLQEGYYVMFKKKFRHQVMLNHFKQLRDAQVAAHEKIEKEFMEKELNLFSITIENNEDFDILPRFNYTRETIFPEGFVKPSGIGCKCKDCSHETGNCCPSKAKKKHNFAYKAVGNTKRIRLRNKQMIKECGSDCECGPDCLNRVTQQPRPYPLIIFKTSDGRGWGVKTAAPIPRGIFVLEYTGEIIDQEESLRRGAEQDERGLRYMFDLDYNENVDAVYTIDAGNYGNLSRLINHNCEPNCLIWPVTTCSEDTSIYKLCYFTTRAIKAGEELSIDYTGASETLDDIEGTMDNAEIDLENDIAGQGNNIAHRHQKYEVTCKCGSAKCRGKMFL